MKLTESHLRNIIKKELKEMMGAMSPPGAESSLDSQLYDFLNNEAETGGTYTLFELARRFDATQEEVRQAFEEGGDMFRPYEHWCSLAIVKYDDSEAA